MWIRSFRTGKRWLPGTIKEKNGRVMHKVSVEGSNVIWNDHANQLKVRAVILPTSSNSTDSNSSTNTDNSTEAPVPMPVPPTLRCSTRIRRPRKLCSSSS